MTYNTRVSWFSGSPPARRVLCALEAKGIEYESNLLQASKGEHKSEAMLALNPRGQVPVLEDNGNVICESVACLLYLEEKYPDVPLLPTDLDERAKVYQRMFETQALGEAGRDAIIMQMRGLVKTEEDQKVFEEKAEKLRAELQRWEDYMGDDEYIVGSQLTLADIMLVTQIAPAWRFGCDFTKFPKLREYRERCEELPAFKNTFPPHWLEDTERRTALALLDQ